MVESLRSSLWNLTIRMIRNHVVNFSCRAHHRNKLQKVRRMNGGYSRDVSRSPSNIISCSTQNSNTNKLLWRRENISYLPFTLSIYFVFYSRFTFTSEKRFRCEDCNFFSLPLFAGRRHPSSMGLVSCSFFFLKDYYCYTEQIYTQHLVGENGTFAL